MARFTVNQLLHSALVILLFAPVVLASGTSEFRLVWSSHRMLGVPASTWGVVTLVLIYVALVFVFSRLKYGEVREASGIES